MLKLNMWKDNSEAEDFRHRMVIAICGAGSDRSGYIAQELNSRGYVASQGGVNSNLTTSDLFGVGSIIFASKHEKDLFDRNKRLRNYVKENDISVYVMNITESDKERALQSENLPTLKSQIASDLDTLGFKNLN